ncbi:MAG: hypothetical protein WCT77_05385 [Bacteroidota bacterium]
MKNNHKSIFQVYYSKESFKDRFIKNSQNAVDVIIPLIHSNELWEKNLISIYREIPVNRLLIGDGGCIDDSIQVVKKFPRVRIFDHKKYISLGYSIKKLIEEVETNWFVYLHSDVYLPDGWFDGMKKYQKRYDWFECRQHLTVLVDYSLNYPKEDRSFSGSQMGRKTAFKKILSHIDDDYLYRNEDIVYSEYIRNTGLKYGRVANVFHYHQLMSKHSRWERKIKNISVEIERGRNEENREWIMQAKGIIKYTKPNKEYLINSVRSCITQLYTRKNFNIKKFETWVIYTNPEWFPYIKNIQNNKSYINKFKNLISILTSKLLNTILSEQK